MRTTEKTYTPYEYKTVVARNDMEGIWRDGLENFGWKLEKARPVAVRSSNLLVRVLLAPLALLPFPGIRQTVIGRGAAGQVELTFSRNKILGKKPELKRLQSEFEFRVTSIGKMEDAKVSAANIFSLLIGFIGVALLAGAIFALLASALPLFIALGSAGLACCVVTYFVYCAIKKKKTREVTPYIENEYDTISKVCEKSYLAINTA